MYRQIKAQNLSELVVEKIIGLIDEGKLKPGDKLPAENTLAEQLGVSRGVLREALIILQFQGFITRKPKDGTYIRSLQEINKENNSMTALMKKATYNDFIEVREALEIRTVELAIDRAKDEDIEEIKEFINSINLDNDSYNLMDYNFHLKIAELSHNNLLINFIDNYYGLIEELGQISNKNRERKLEIIEEHKNIIEAISLRDKDLAVKAIKHHLRKIKEII